MNATTRTAISTMSPTPIPTSQCSHRRRCFAGGSSFDDALTTIEPGSHLGPTAPGIGSAGGDGVHAACRVLACALGEQLEGVRVARRQAQARDPGVGPRDVALADALDRTDEAALVDVLVGDRRDRLVLAVGEEELLD